MGKYVVRYVENGVEKESQEFTNRDEAFLFQTGILARRKMTADGTWDVDSRGVYNISPAGR